MFESRVFMKAKFNQHMYCSQIFKSLTHRYLLYKSRLHSGRKALNLNEIIFISNGCCETGQLTLNMSFRCPTAHIACDVKGTAVRQKSARTSLTSAFFLIFSAFEFSTLAHKPFFSPLSGSRDR